MNKGLHDTFLRQGELKVEVPGEGVMDGFNKACTLLQGKLHKIAHKPDAMKKDYRHLP